jgi:hypothetical protein
VNGHTLHLAALLFCCADFTCNRAPHATPLWSTPKPALTADATPPEPVSRDRADAWAPPVLWQDGVATSPPGFTLVRGWGPLRWNMQVGHAMHALDGAKVAFAQKRFHKTGEDYLTLDYLARPGWSATVYFSGSEPRTLSQILLISPRLSTKDEADSILREHSQLLGAPMESKDGYRDALREDRLFRWRSSSTDLEITLAHNRFADLASKRSVFPDDPSEQLDDWTVFIDYSPHR